MKKLIIAILLISSLKSYSQIYKWKVDTIEVISIDSNNIAQLPVFGQSNSFVTTDFLKKSIIIYSPTDSLGYNYTDIKSTSLLPENTEFFMNDATDYQNRKLRINIQFLDKNKIGCMYGNHDGILQIIYPDADIVYFLRGYL